jgi:putative phosphoesterase
LIHCGDVTSSPILAELTGLPSWFVLGNNDVDDSADLERMARELGVNFLGSGGLVELAGKRIGIVHGHLYHDIRRLLAARPDYLLYGHTHIPASEKIDGVHRINPGALHRAPKFSVATLDLENGNLLFHDVPR